MSCEFMQELRKLRKLSMESVENTLSFNTFRNFEKVVLFFASETEKRLFEKYVCTNIPRLNKRVEESEAYNYVETGNEVKTADYKKCLRTAIALNAMLKEFREYTNQKAIVD